MIRQALISHVVVIWSSSSTNLIFDTHIVFPAFIRDASQFRETWFAHITVPVNGIYVYWHIWSVICLYIEIEESRWSGIDKVTH